MKTLSPGALAALSAGSVAVVQFVRLGFLAPLGLNNSTWNFTHGGLEYKGAAGLAGITPVQDTSGSQVQGIEFTLNGVASEYVSLALDDSDLWQGTEAKLSTALISTANYQIVDVLTDWTGYGDTMAIQRSGGQQVIQATAEPSAVDLLKGHALTYSDADQQLLFAGDRGCEYVVDQAAKPVVWPERAFFFK